MTTAAARAAMIGRNRSRLGLLQQWERALEPGHDRVWRTVLTLFASLGRPPHLREVGAATGLAIDHVREIIGELEAHDLLGSDQAADLVRYAYPFTGDTTEHCVRLHGRRLYALCAIDALGVGGMFGTDVIIAASCRACRTRVEMATAEGGKALGYARPAAAVVWYDLGYSGCAAASNCRSTAFFCSDADQRRWLQAHNPPAAGYRLTIEEALEVGRAIFEPVLAPAASSSP